MKKLILTVLIFAVLSSFAGATALAARPQTPAKQTIDTDDVSEEQENALDTQDLENGMPDSAEKILGNLTVKDSTNADGFLQKMAASAGKALKGILKSAVSGAAAIIAIAVLCSMASTLSDGGKLPDYAVLGGVLAIMAVSAGNVTSFLGLGKELIGELSDFSTLLLPTLSAAAVASGAVTSAAAKYAVTALFMNILITTINKLLIPLIYAYITAAFCGAAVGGDGLAAAAKLIKKVTMAILTVIMLAFTLYLTISGVISATTDATAAKLAKTAISTVLPVVGGIISDAASTVAGAVSVLKNAVGIFGLIVICATCLVPFLRLGVHYLIYKVAAALTSAIADERLAKLTDAVATAFGLTLGVTGASALMLFISIISVLKVVTG